MNIFCSGSGSPTVVLDGAIGSSMYVWRDVQPAIAAHTRVCSYDRAGYGFSDPGGFPHTTDSNVRDMRALLQNAGVAPPYVLVAHSLNAFDARLFADRYTREVSGIVLLDPSDLQEDRMGSIFGRKKLDAEQQANLQFLRLCDAKARSRQLKPGDDCVGPAEPHVPAAFARVQMQHKLSRAMWDAILSEMTSLRTDLREVSREQRPYGTVPLIVLTAGAAQEQGASPGTSKAQIAAANALVRQMREADAALSSRGVNCTVAGAGHYLQLERPAVVAAAALEAVRLSRTPAMPSCAIILKAH